MKTSIKISGLRELKASLEGFKKSTARGVMERALKKAAKPIEADARTAAPELTGDLKGSIKTIVIRTSAGKSAYARVMRDGGSKDEAAGASRAANRSAAGQGASARVRVQATAPHAHFAEFGTIKQPAQPFMGPALRKNHNAVLANIRTELASEIKKTSARLAKRKARK